METASPDVLVEGFVTEDDRWICPECFHDLKNEMGWKLVPRESGT
jgi:hypothetical protein